MPAFRRASVGVRDRHHCAAAAACSSMVGYGSCAELGPFRSRPRGASATTSALRRPSSASRQRRRTAWQCPCSMCGRRKMSRGPGRRGMAPHKTRGALPPVSAPWACAPGRAPARRTPGKRRRPVSAAPRSPGWPGSGRSQRTLAPFLAPGTGLAPQNHRGAAGRVPPWRSSAAGGEGDCADRHPDDAEAPRAV
jgi:hypothetical protein